MEKMKRNRWWRKVGLVLIIMFFLLDFHVCLYLMVSKSPITVYLNADEVIGHGTSMVGEEPIEEAMVWVESNFEWGKRPHIVTEIEENGLIYLHLTQVSSLVGRRAAAVNFKSNVIDDTSGASLSFANVNKIITVSASKQEEIIWEKD